MSTQIKNAKRFRVRILNPPHGHTDQTSLAHARRYVKRGVAEWENGALRFLAVPLAGLGAKVTLPPPALLKPDARGECTGALDRPFVSWPLKPRRNAGRVVVEGRWDAI